MKMPKVVSAVGRKAVEFGRIKIAFAKASAERKTTISKFNLRIRRKKAELNDLKWQLHQAKTNIALNQDVKFWTQRIRLLTGQIENAQNQLTNREKALREFKMQK